MRNDATLWFVGRFPGDHRDAVDDGADTIAEGAAGAAVCDHREMRLGVKRDCLQEKESLTLRIMIKVSATVEHFIQNVQLLFYKSYLFYKYLFYNSTTSSQVTTSVRNAVYPV